MKRILAVGLLGLAGLAVGCGGDGTSCGTGTHEVDGVCVPDGVTQGDGSVQNTGCATACGTNQVCNTTTGKCDLTAAACTQGLVLSADKQQCVKANSGDLVAGPLKMDQHWFFWKYLNGTSLSVLGDATHITATVPDTTEMYMAGVGTGPPGSGPTDPAKNDKFGSHNGGVLPVYWDANPSKPSDTPLAIDHVITVGEWKTCSVTWSVYKNPPRKDNKKYYRMVMDATGCPADLIFEVWFNYFTDKFVNTRILGTPAGGLPNVFAILQDGTGHWERDFDPNVWTKFGASLNGNVHGTPGGPDGKGVIPSDPGAAANVPSFTPAIFAHNDGQSNGNAGWCSTADVGGVPGVCGTPQYVNSAPQATPTTKSYVYLPGKVGYESTPSFGGGSDPTATVANTIPLSMLQPY